MLKVIQYCSVECQKEHWKLVHRRHCTQLAEDKKAEKEDVNLYSHHPFPISGMQDDITENLVRVVQEILSRMRSTRHPLLKVFPAAFKDLEEKMEWNRALIWSGRKVTPQEGIQDVTGDLEASLGQELHGASLTLRNLCGKAKDPLGLFRTLCLMSELQVFHKTLLLASSFKEPLKAVPAEFWDKVESGSIFSERLEAMIKAFGQAQFPSHLDLMKIYCGGSLIQNCSFCGSSMKVAAAVVGFEVPVVAILPYLRPMFSCGAKKCSMALNSKMISFTQWSSAIKMTFVKLKSTRCDFCFKRTDQVHRSFFGMFTRSSSEKEPKFLKNTVFS